MTRSALLMLAPALAILLAPRTLEAAPDLARLVETRKLSLSVKARPLASVLEQLEAETKVPLFLDPEGAVGAAPITLETKERESFRALLDAVAKQATAAGPASGVDAAGKRTTVTWKIVGGVIVVGRSSALGWYHLKAPRRKVKAAHGKALGKTRTLTLKDADLDAALKALGEQTAIPIRRSAEMAKRPAPTTTVTLTARRPLHELIMLVFGRLRVVWTLSEAEQDS